MSNIKSKENPKCQNCKKAETMMRKGTLELYYVCGHPKHEREEIRLTAPGCGDHVPFEVDMSPVPNQLWMTPTQIQDFV